MKIVIILNRFCISYVLKFIFFLNLGYFVNDFNTKNKGWFHNIYLKFCFLEQTQIKPFLLLFFLLSLKMMFKTITVSNWWVAGCTWRKEFCPINLNARNWKHQWLPLLNVQLNVREKNLKELLKHVPISPWTGGPSSFTCDLVPIFHHTAAEAMLSTSKCFCNWCTIPA